MLLKVKNKEQKQWQPHANHDSYTFYNPGADPGFFLGGGALVSCSTSTPINHIVFLQNTSCIRKPQVISGRGGVHPLHPPPRSAPVIIDHYSSINIKNLLLLNSQRFFCRLFSVDTVLGCNKRSMDAVLLRKSNN